MTSHTLSRGTRSRTGEPTYSPHVTALAAAYARRRGVTARAGQRRLERLTEDLVDFAAVAADVPGGILKLARLIGPALAAMRGAPGDVVEAVLVKSEADAAEDAKIAAYLAHPNDDNRKALISAMQRESAAASRALAALEAM